MADSHENPFHKSELTTILVVADMEKSKDFYLNKLGAELYREYGGTSVVLKFLGNWLLLVTSGGPSEDKPDVSFAPPENKNHVSHSFTIRVQHCRKSYETLKAKGIEFITPPKEWGSEIRCFFYDPDGHLFEISESK
ncbi:catechol 2,3-dioxygenase-like lactoylglutathione lyase family enzyme [Pontibacter aydingkolensis]|uniref:VOC family protein n=1 Tax=Pontibacter aydingkolensis TaxID=1911536 RepID=A0ABS7CPV8_9BACT|nr:VOC family protein [Pontibacter aydingkolensis]MBW7465838.1 VOC family protein [Pontibacter aydingkolensis]